MWLWIHHCLVQAEVNLMVPKYSTCWRAGGRRLEGKEGGCGGDGYGRLMDEALVFGDDAWTMDEVFVGGEQRWFAKCKGSSRLGSILFRYRGKLCFLHIFTGAGSFVTSLPVVTWPVGKESFAATGYTQPLWFLHCLALDVFAQPETGIDVFRSCSVVVVPPNWEVVISYATCFTWCCGEQMLHTPLFLQVKGAL